MAKTPKMKAKAFKSIHSRAAKRAASPTDKSLLTSLPRPDPTATVKPHVLAAKHNAGITKKSKSKQLTRAQRRRQEKGLERAELVIDRTEKKVAKRMGKAKIIKARRATWEVMNERALAADQSKVASLDDGDDADLMVEDESKRTAAPLATKATNSLGLPQKPAMDQKYEFEEDGEIT
ncbi:hypothetical protein ACO22_02412 [Paracoccidioides brasiliensis]|uniref:Uncharacterized protein n=1 Tax=Paracoccidioides brasiliensis TaxID=121759 RepID=A0A1D2JIT5_PARBR|nr:hypothetical protein ACO22_02412 [Paracoccidioides brasiliensis]ODH46810.1 hypothetical protein GX48_07072 [Paracoccidioides brasiliensis]